MCFFSRFLGSRKYKIQIVAHVGRKSAVVLSGTMEASYPHFFIGIDFNLVNNRNLSLCKNEGRKPPSSLRVRRPTSSRRGLLSESCTSSIRGTWKKNRWSCEITAWKNVTNTAIDSHATLSQNSSKCAGDISKNTGEFTSTTNQIRLVARST